MINNNNYLFIYLLFFFLFLFLFVYFSTYLFEQLKLDLIVSVIFHLICQYANTVEIFLFYQFYNFLFYNNLNISDIFEFYLNLLLPIAL